MSKLSEKKVANKIAESLPEKVCGIPDAGAIVHIGQLVKDHAFLVTKKN